MTFWDRLEQIRMRHDVLQHPFYQRWSAGELTPGELALYAAEYRHAVVALADASAKAAADGDPGLEAHAREEADHIRLWDQFAAAVGADLEQAPLAQTRACAEAWAGSERRSQLETLTALYAIESAQPAISATKLEGLRAHYGIADADATAYFSLHMTRDMEHAREERELIAQRLDGVDQAPLLACAERVLRANWELLDGVQAA